MAITKLQDWELPARTGDLQGSTLGAPPAGTNRMFVLVVSYKNSDCEYANYFMDGVPATSIHQSILKAATPYRASIVVVWDETAIQSFTNGALSISYLTGSFPNNLNWSYAYFEGDNLLQVADSDTFEDAASGTGLGPLAMTATGVEHAVACACLDQDTSFSASAGWTEIYDNAHATNFISWTAVEGALISDVNADLTLTAAASGTFRTLSGIVISELAGDAINDVNGNDEVRRLTLLNQVNGAGFTNATGVTIGGVTQDDFNVVDDALITFATKLQAASDLKYGAQTLVVQRPTGDLNIAITLLPAVGFAYVDVAGLPWPAGSRSIFDGLVPAVSDGDQCEYSTTTEPIGQGLVVNPDGTWTLTGGGTDSQSFPFFVWRALDSNSWSSELRYYINFGPVITAVSTDDISDITEGPVDIDGDNFGEAQLGSKMYLNMAGVGMDGNEVEQTVSAWSNQKVTLTGWTLGALPGGTDMQVIVEVE